MPCFRWKPEFIYLEVTWLFPMFNLWLDIMWFFLFYYYLTLIGLFTLTPENVNQLFLVFFQSAFILFLIWSQNHKDIVYIFKTCDPVSTIIKIMCHRVNGVLWTFTSILKIFKTFFSVLSFTVVYNYNCLYQFHVLSFLFVCFLRHSLIQ